MNANKSETTALMLEIVIIFVTIYSLWYKVLLPTTYYVAIILLAALLLIQILKNCPSKLLVLQIVLLFLLVRNVYHLSTNCATITFGDAYYEYAVAKTFMQKGSISVIQQLDLPAKKLTWYSGWPALHTIAVFLSQISGIEVFHLFLLLPSIFGLISFAFAYLLIEKVRKALRIDARVTPLALLIYTTSPESVGWQMQLVRQSLGILLLTIMFYLVYLMTANPRDRKYKALAIFFAMALVIVHHYTSFMTISYLFSFFALLTIGKYVRRSKYLGETKVARRLFWPSPKVSTLVVALAAFGFLFIWWNLFGTFIWPIAGGRLRLFLQIISGARETEFFLPLSAYYPSQLTPMWVLLLSRLRDIVMYVPLVFGLLFISIQRLEKPQRFMVVYSTLVFGVLFLVDNLSFKLEPYRVIALSLPLIALLSATSYTQITKRLNRIWSVFVTAAIVIVLLLSSFIGLWAHNFAPLHLYDPSVNPMEVGENNVHFLRVSDFLAEKVSTEKFDLIWADDINPLFFMLKPDEVHKIRRAPTEDIQALGCYGRELLCEFKVLNLYLYYASSYSPVETLEEAAIVKHELEQQLQIRFSYTYDNGKCRLWTNVANVYED